MSWNILDPKDRKVGAGIVVLMIFNAILDFFNIAFFLPLIIIIVQPDLTKTNPLVNDLYHNSGASSQSEFILIVTGGILAFTIVKTLIASRIASAKASYAFSISSSISAKAVSWFTSKPYREYTKSDYSKELNLIVNHPLAFGNNIVIPVATIISESFILLLITISIAIFDFKILFVLSLIFVPASLLFIYRKRGLKRIKEIIKEKYPEALKRVLQLIEGYPEVKSYQKQTFFTENYRRTHDSLTKAFTRDHVLQTSTTRITEVIAAAMICCLISYAVFSDLAYQQTIILLSVYASASFRLIPSLNRILTGLQQIHTHEYIIEELAAIQQPLSQVPAKGPIDFVKRIELKQISLRYDDGAFILKDADVHFDKSSKTAITGKSGEGKTTLLLFLLGFLNAETGELLIDEKVSSTGLQGIAAYVPQNPYMLDATLSENIAFGVPEEKIDHSKISRIIRDMDLESLVSDLPNGVNSRIGEKGVKLSGGQRQRIALARALYADASVLLLDEVTNQVNHSLELEILKALDFLSSQGKTIIMVTHKIAQQDFFDRVYKLENRKFTEELLQPQTRP